MSTGYQITSQNGLYFVTFTIVDWVDIFSGKIYRDIIVDSLNYCIKNKGLKVYAWVIMTNHVHLIIESANENLSDIIRDIKKFTAYKIIEAIKNEPESRREWILHRFSYNASLRSANTNYQVWTHENHSIEIFTKEFFVQKSNYIHQNPVRAGWIEEEENYLYSSAGAFYNKPSKIPLSFI